MKKIVLFASGSGTNAENIIRYFEQDLQVSIICVLSNKRQAGVLDRCARLGVGALYFNRHAFVQSDTVLKLLEVLEPDLIVLAGFLWKIPEKIIASFPEKIINIHPALLPKYGGKGMYGIKVHQAVKENEETETGITIHYVNENYDEGNIIHQEAIPINKTDLPEDIAGKVHQLEYEHFPKVIERLLLDK